MGGVAEWITKPVAPAVTTGSLSCEKCRLARGVLGARGGYRGGAAPHGGVAHGAEYLEARCA